MSINQISTFWPIFYPNYVSGSTFYNFFYFRGKIQISFLNNAQNTCLSPKLEFSEMSQNWKYFIKGFFCESFLQLEFQQG